MQHLDIISGKYFFKIFQECNINVEYRIQKSFWLTRRLSSESKSWTSREDSVNDMIKCRWNQSDRYFYPVKKYIIFGDNKENLQVVVAVHSQVSFHKGRQISYKMSFLIYLVFCDNLKILLFQFSNWYYTLGGKHCPVLNVNIFFSEFSSLKSNIIQNRTWQYGTV